MLDSDTSHSNSHGKILAHEFPLNPVVRVTLSLHSKTEKSWEQMLPVCESLFWSPKLLITGTLMNFKGHTSDALAAFTDSINTSQQMPCRAHFRKNGSEFLLSKIYSYQVFGFEVAKWKPDTFLFNGNGSFFLVDEYLMQVKDMLDQECLGGASVATVREKYQPVNTKRDNDNAERKTEGEEETFILCL